MVAAATDDLIVSAARDKTVRSWSRIAPNAFSLHNIYLGHDHFVNSLAIIKPNEAFPEGFFFIEAERQRKKGLSTDI